MTTIIVTADEVAGDGLAKNGHDRILSRSVKKIHVCKGHIYAFAGAGSMMEPLMQWHWRDGCAPDKLPKSDQDGGWSMIVIGPNERLFYTSKQPYADIIEVPFAMGFGGDYALGAVAAGADARRAIEIACMYDAYTGGDIQVVNIAEALAPLKEAAE